MTFMEDIGKKLKNAELQLSIASTKDKNFALEEVSKAIDKSRDEILKANKVDVEVAKDQGMKEGLIDRLKLDHDRIDGIIDGINTVIKLADPVWQSDRAWTMENDLTITKMTVPLGVIGIIYESRPNVTVDAFALALKSGNCIILRGSSSAINSNIALAKAIKEGLENSNISPDAVAFIEDTDRAIVGEMLVANKYIDLIIPRGGKDLIDFVVKESSVPTLQTGEGNCHLFVDKSGDLEDAFKILINAKTQRLGVCNTIETLLVHKDIGEEFLKTAYEGLKGKIEMRGCKDTRAIIDVKEASEEDFKEEYLDAIIAIKVVEGIDEAISHINKYGTKHSESIVTNDLVNANKFKRQVDASSVYVNASTRFTDGSEFGFGAEMGISTQKIHARGPVGLEQLVTYKYLIDGQGQIRG